MSEVIELKRFDERALAASIDDMRQGYDLLNGQYEENIRHHTDRLSERDVSEFREFLEVLKQESLAKLHGFFVAKVETKGESFTFYDTDHDQQNTQLETERQQLTEDLTEEFDLLKLIDSKKNQRTENLLSAFVKNTKAKACFNLWKHYHMKKAYSRKLEQQLDEQRADRQRKRSFFAWRNHAYKPAYEQKIRLASESDVMVFEQNYLEIIKTLKEEIERTDEVIAQKTEEKTQMAIELSHGLMKTITSLSNEVISLNNVAVLASQNLSNLGSNYNQRHNTRIQQVIDDKYQSIRNLKQTYSEQTMNNTATLNRQQGASTAITFVNTLPKHDTFPRFD